MNLMDARGFDVLGVRTTKNATADKWVSRDRLDADVALWKTAEPLLALQSVERSMPLIGLMELLLDRPHVFVLDQDTVGHIVTRADLAKPPVSLLVLTYLLALEQDLITLSISRLGSNWFDHLVTDDQVQAMKVYNKRRRNHAEMGLEDCLYFDHAMGLTLEAPGLLGDLGTTTSAFQHLRNYLGGLRNDLAHGGTILDRRPNAVDALRDFRTTRLLTEKAAVLVRQQPSLDSAYAATVITDAKGRVLAGGNPVVPLPSPGRAHVVTAYNPGSRTQPRDRNEQAQRALRNDLRGHGIRTINVTGASPDGLWSEPSIMFTGRDRGFAAELAHRYGQLAVFELDNDHVRVISSKSNVVLFEGPRVKPGS